MVANGKILILVTETSKVMNINVYKQNVVCVIAMQLPVQQMVAVSSN